MHPFRSINAGSGVAFSLLGRGESDELPEGHALLAQGRGGVAERLVVESLPVIREATGEPRYTREARERGAEFLGRPTNSSGKTGSGTSAKPLQ